MNMNDRGWDAFWDNEPDDDDEDFNDVGSDIDANNDETFDNAAEWNEDEHENLIARDSILSHTLRSNQASVANNNRVNERSISGSSNTNNNNNRSNDLSSERAYCFSAIASASRSGWNSLGDKDSFPALERRENIPHVQPDSSNSLWQNVQNTSERLHLLQLQQQQLLIQKRLQEQEQLKQQQLRDHQMLQQQQQQQLRDRLKGSVQAETTRQVLRVDELERKLLKTNISEENNGRPLPKFNSTAMNDLPKRTGWSPFGGKDIFATPDSPTQAQLNALNQNLLLSGQLQHTLTIEQQQQILIHHQLLMKQQLLQQMASQKQQQIEQEQRLMSQNPQCFTVEELERQMLANRSNQTQSIHNKNNAMVNQESSVNKRKNDTHNRNEKRDGDRHDRYEKEAREHREFKDNNRRDHRDHRDRREFRDYKNQNKRSLAIIPPQVQLKVIDKAKKSHLITTVHSDQFLQDRMPTSEHGFLYKRHSKLSSDKAIHDGVLTEKERNWLTKIQEKIQADYDNNLDQDYYYLLYFNRSSMTDEAAQKPCGPGVLDRRFIPRERLLYDSST